MVINEKALVSRMKEAYKTGSYTVICLWRYKYTTTTASIGLGLIGNLWA